MSMNAGLFDIQVSVGTQDLKGIDHTGATLVTTIYLHRGLSHRALTMRPGLVAVLRVLTTGTDRDGRRQLRIRPDPDPEERLCLGSDREHVRHLRERHQEARHDTA